MTVRITVGNETYEFSPDCGFDLSIPVQFIGEVPQAFSLPAANVHPVQAGTFTGDTKQGGTCNCVTITVTPHGNGTHTEGIGHLTDEPAPIHVILKDTLIPATLITVTPRKSGNDNIITEKILADKLTDANKNFLAALVVRTEPNDESKTRRAYSGTNPPYFGADAIEYLHEAGVSHILTDLPSLDKETDPDLTAHRIFWKLPESGHALPENFSRKTITEMIYAGPGISDGRYILNLQIPAIAADAAPSRPIIFPVEAVRS